MSVRRAKLAHQELTPAEADDIIADLDQALAKATTARAAE